MFPEVSVKQKVEELELGSLLGYTKRRRDLDLSIDTLESSKPSLGRSTD